MAKNRVCKKVVSVDTKSISFTDLTKPNGATFTADVTKLPGFHPAVTGLALRSLLHGVSQKLGDTYADGDDPIAGVTAAFESLVAGEWSQRGEAGPRDSILLEALAAIHGKTAELYKTDREKAIATAREMLDKAIAKDARANKDPKVNGGKPIDPDKDEDAFESFTEAYMKGLRSQPGVKAEMDKISARRASERAAKSATAATTQPVKLGF